MKFLERTYEASASFAFALWELLILVGIVAQAIVVVLAKKVSDLSKAKYQSICDSVHKWAWDKDKKLTPEQRAKDWATAFTDGHDDWKLESIFWQRPTWWKFWEPRQLTIPQDRMGRINGDWFVDDPAFDGYRKFDQRNPDRFKVEYDENLNRIWPVETKQRFGPKVGKQAKIEKALDTFLAS